VIFIPPFIFIDSCLDDLELPDFLLSVKVIEKFAPEPDSKGDEEGKPDDQACGT
jgi:hypothetical protein